MNIENIKKSKAPFLTIGIASYNYEKYLPIAFEAIKKQKFQDFELLYCDDGSTDQSVEVIKKIIQENPDTMIRLIEGKNLGVMGNKNRIIENANGKYLMLCDADDKMLGNCLEVLCHLALESDADQVVGAFEQVDDFGNVIQIQHIPSNLSRWTWGAHHATLYKMSVIRDNNLKFDTRFYPDDMYFNMLFHNKSETFKYVDEVVYDWNMHSDSTSATKAIEEEKDKWHGFQLLKSTMEYVVPIAEKHSGRQFAEIEYATIKMYCLSVLYRSRKNFGVFWKEYKKINEMMRESFPNYKKNEFVISKDAKKIVRKETARIIYIFILAEKMGLSFLVLFAYWIMLKFRKVTV